MITRPLVRSRSGRSIRQRDAWIAFEDSAASRALEAPAESASPDRTYPRGARADLPSATASADHEDRSWVVSYQRGEIIALAGALALVGLGGAGSVAVERILSGLLGKSRLAARPEADPLPRPGSVVVEVPAH